MVLVRNDDKPGLIGSVGSIFGRAGINIATLHLGRSGPGGDAIALAAVDGPINDLLLAEICAIKNVTGVKLLKF
jgi:D-3-phosphoglycerate dehydrogenase